MSLPPANPNELRTSYADKAKAPGRPGVLPAKPLPPAKMRIGNVVTDIQFVQRSLQTEEDFTFPGLRQGDYERVNALWRTVGGLPSRALRIHFSNLAQAMVAKDRIITDLLSQHRDNLMGISAHIENILLKQEGRISNDLYILCNTLEISNPVLVREKRLRFLEELEGIFPLDVFESIKKFSRKIDFESSFRRNGCVVLKYSQTVIFALEVIFHEVPLFLKEIEMGIVCSIYLEKQPELTKDLPAICKSILYATPFMTRAVRCLIYATLAERSEIEFYPAVQIWVFTDLAGDDRYDTVEFDEDCWDEEAQCRKQANDFYMQYRYFNEFEPVHMYSDGLRLVCTNLPLDTEFGIMRADIKEFFSNAKFGPKTKRFLEECEEAYALLEGDELFPITEEQSDNEEPEVQLGDAVPHVGDDEIDQIIDDINEALEDLSEVLGADEPDIVEEQNLNNMLEY